MAKKLVIGGVTIKPGERKRILLDVAKLYDFTNMNIPIEVIRGKEDGPVLFVSGAVHGDEINGVEIIRRLLNKKALKTIKGTLIAVPIVNVFGFNTKSRYLPDRRDLNRCFPGSQTGSLAAQMAHTFLTEVVDHCTHGIDLHCASNNRVNLPQIRGWFDEKMPELKKMAKAFRSPVIVHSPMLEGSLRHATYMRGIPILLFEGGESLRFNEKVIASGLTGVMNVMRELKMLKPLKEKKHPHDTFTAKSSHWLRAPHSGILAARKQLGQRVKKGQVMGVISDPFGQDKHEIRAKRKGIIIGISAFPLLNKGDAVFHVATFEDTITVEEHIDIFDEHHKVRSNDRFLD